MFKQLQLYAIGAVALIAVGAGVTATVQTYRFRAADARADAAELQVDQYAAQLAEAKLHDDKNRAARDRAFGVRDQALQDAEAARNALSAALDNARNEDEDLDRCLRMQLPDGVLLELP